MGLAAALTGGCYDGLDAASGLPTAAGDNSDDDTSDVDEPFPGGDDDGPAQLCNDRNPGPVVVRRLTRYQYTNTLQDLLGTDTETGAFISNLEVAGFVETPPALSEVSELAGYSDAAMALADTAIQTSLETGQPFPELATASSHDDEQTIRAFIADFGRRAFRRPVPPDEVDRYFAVYQAGRDEHDATTGVQWMLHGLLAAPSFVYHLERGDPTKARDDGRVPLTSHERANRLAYLLTGSSPDPTLASAADDDALTTVDQVQEQARRLLNTPRGRQQIGRFFLEWMELQSADPSRADIAKTFDLENPTVLDDLRQSVLRTVEYVLDGPTPTLAGLLTTPTFFANRTLAESWGLQAEFGEDFSEVEVPSEKRAGLLTHPAFVALQSAGTFASATLRGKFVNSHLLCEEVPSPDEQTLQKFPDIQEELATDRETLEILHLVDSGCAACHNVLDPPGFAFENYDRFGHFRSEQMSEAGVATPIDATGEILLDGKLHPYQDAIDMGAALAQSEEVQACFARQVFRFAMGRNDVLDADACNLETISLQLPATGATIEDMFVAVTATDAFLYMGR